MSRSKDDALGDKIDLSHLGLGFSRTSLASEPLQNEAECVDIADNAVDLYDIEKIKKKIIVLFMERMLLFMISPRVSLSDKVTKGLAAMAQWEGTRRIVEWDKRLPDEKDLLAKAEKLGQQIIKYSKDKPKASMGKLQIEAAEKLMTDLTKEKN